MSGAAGMEVPGGQGTGSEGRGACNEAEASPAGAAHTRPGRFWKECGFYLNCIRPTSYEKPFLMSQKELTMPSPVPPWIWVGNVGNPAWQHPGCFLVFSGIDVRPISSQGQRRCLYSSLFPGPGTPAAYGRYHTFIRGVSGAWKRILQIYFPVH